MAFTPTSGQYATVESTVTNTAISVPGINWTLNKTANTKDVSNFRDGRRRSGTLPDWNISLTLVWDSAANPLLAANGGLTEGTQLTAITLFTDVAQTNTKTFFGAGIVATIAPKASGVEDVIMMDCTIEANGQMTNPTT